jgi:aminoglycoside 3-N-acetyltransferase
MSREVTKEGIKHDLKRIGLGRGDSVFVHSSMKSLGFVRGGPQAVISAFLEVLEASGALMVPTFTFTNFQPFFHIENTPSEMGLITETVRQREDSIRSLHPRHSVSVIGQGAKELVQGHLDAGSLGVESPVDKLCKIGGYILLLGVGHNVNSVIHLAEAYADVPYLYSWEAPDFPHIARVKYDGHEQEVSLAPSPGCSEGFGKIEPVLRSRGIIKDGKIGEAQSQLMKAQDVVDAAVELLRSDPKALLCDDNDCYSCREKRKSISKALGVAGLK